jgi:hypothetical protein
MLRFDEIASIGADICKDPRTSAEWDKASVLRLKNGRTWKLANHTVMKAVARHAAWPISDKIVWCKEPLAEYG